MDDRSVHSLESAIRDLVHLIKEGFLPVCVGDGQGGVAVFLVGDRDSLLILHREVRQLLSRGSTIEDVYARAVVDKLWYEMSNPLAASRLVHRAEALVEQAA